MKGYYIEKGMKFKHFRRGWILEEHDMIARHASVRNCVDLAGVYTLNGEKGILMFRRDNTPPAAGWLWYPGGEHTRGYTEENALKLKIKKETNLDISNLEFLAKKEFLWKNSPYDANKNFLIENKLGLGVHDIGNLYFAICEGTLELKSLENPQILTLNNFERILKDEAKGKDEKAYDYVLENIPKALQIARDKNFL